jgi:prolyl oligopeptidase
MKTLPFTSVAASLLCAVAAAAAAQPGTPRLPVSDAYHGVRVVDDYRWLENGDNPKVKAWSEAQNSRARTFLDRLPGTAALRARIEHLLTARSASIGGFIRQGGKFFAVSQDPARKQQPWIVLLPSLANTEGVRTLVDPNVIDPTGHTAFDWFVPSADGSKLAVSLSQGGSEAGTLHVYDVTTGKETGDVIPRVQVGTAGGSAAWTADGKGLWYTRYPHDGERSREDLDFYQQVYFHELGAPVARDGYSLGRELPRIAEIALSSSEDGRLHLALVQNGDSGDYAVYFLPEGATVWQSLSTFADGLIEAHFGRDGAIWVISKKGAPKKRVLRIPLDNPTLAAARTVLDQREGVIEAIEPTRSRLYTIEALSGKGRIRAYDLQGNLVEELPTPPVSAAAALQRLDGNLVFYGVTSFLQPYSGYVYDPAKKVSTPTVVHTAPVADFSDAEVVEEGAISKDGTRVPMFILQPKGTKRDGRNPVVLTGYGGFGISQTPSYSDLAHVYTERGVVQVSALLRGGGEFGQEWHDAGRLTRKQNVFDDFLACARRLIELKVTNPGKLAIEGGSNGGLLMGAAFTQAPKLFRAVVSHVGIYDMLRVETSANGQFNTVEFGTVKIPEQFKALYAYSPYHRVKDGTRYPAILMPTGANDPRVDPMQSRKMVARLQAADPKATVLLRTSGGMGHAGIGAGVKDLVSLYTDVGAFLLYELGVPLAPKR